MHISKPFAFFVSEIERWVVAWFGFVKVNNLKQPAAYYLWVLFFMQVQDWNKECPTCKSKNWKGHPVEGTLSWVHQYLCPDCNTSWTVNYGDKQGGGFDVITILPGIEPKSFNVTPP